MDASRLALQAERGDEELLAFDRFAKAGARGLYAAKRLSEMAPPPDAVQDKIGFLLNNTSAANVAEKSLELHELLASHAGAFLAACGQAPVAISARANPERYPAHHVKWTTYNLDQGSRAVIPAQKLL